MNSGVYVVAVDRQLAVLERPGLVADRHGAGLLVERVRQAALARVDLLVGLGDRRRARRRQAALREAAVDRAAVDEVQGAVVPRVVDVVDVAPPERPDDRALLGLGLRDRLLGLADPQHDRARRLQLARLDGDLQRRGHARGLRQLDLELQRALLRRLERRQLLRLAAHARQAARLGERHADGRRLLRAVVGDLERQRHRLVALDRRRRAAERERQLGLLGHGHRRRVRDRRRGRRRRRRRGRPASGSASPPGGVSAFRTAGFALVLSYADAELPVPAGSV